MGGLFIVCRFQWRLGATVVHCVCMFQWRVGATVHEGRLSEDP